jgi:Calx-beta domain-containing protein
VRLLNAVALLAFLAVAPSATAAIPPPRDPVPALSIADTTTIETNFDTIATMEVTLSTPTDDQVTVHWATSDGTADSTDYVPDSGTLTFAPRQTSARIAVMIKGDALDEPDETVYVDLSDANYASIDKARGTLTIVDDPNDRARLKMLDAFVDARWSVHRRYTRAARFAVHAPPDATVRVQCTGLGCRKQLIGAKLKPGARIVVRVTSVGRIGRYFEYRIRAGKRPRVVALCLPLSGSAPGSC